MPAEKRWKVLDCFHEPGGVAGGVAGGVEGGVVGGQTGGRHGRGRSETAPRRARVTGVVIVEAVTNKEGNADKVTVIKGLPMGLSEAAEEAVKRWKFRPPTLNGAPVDVIFNLTVNFTLN